MLVTFHGFYDDALVIMVPGLAHVRSRAPSEASRLGFVMTDGNDHGVALAENGTRFYQPVLTNGVHLLLRILAGELAQKLFLAKFRVLRHWKSALIHFLRRKLFCGRFRYCDGVFKCVSFPVYVCDSEVTALGRRPFVVRKVGCRENLALLDLVAYLYLWDAAEVALLVEGEVVIQLIGLLLTLGGSDRYGILGHFHDTAAEVRLPDTHEFAELLLHNAVALFTAHQRRFSVDKRHGLRSVLASHMKAVGHDPALAGHRVGPQAEHLGGVRDIIVYVLLRDDLDALASVHGGHELAL